MNACKNISAERLLEDREVVGRVSMCHFGADGKIHLPESVTKKSKDAYLSIENNDLGRM